MTLTAFAGFSAAMFILAASPGPGVFAVISRTLSAGFRKTRYMIAGIVTGDLIYLVFAIFGLTYVARNMSQLFLIIRILGGIYLIWTGIKTILSPVEENAPQVNREEVTRVSVYFSGLLITLSNPKVILFYCGFLPAFVDLGSLRPKEGFLIVLLVMLILSSVLLIYSRLAESAGRFVRSPVGRRRLNKGAGGVMIAAGAVLALKK
jgi:threonine/homoserine/homoserine lactone efflux protein